MNIEMSAPFGTVILSVDQYRKLLEDKLIADSNTKNAAQEAEALRESLEQANNNLASACVKQNAMQAEMEGYKSSANLWYDEFRKAKDELESLKARLLALGLRGGEP